MARRDRLKQGQEAKERVMTRLSNGGSSATSNSSSTRRDRLKPEAVEASRTGIDNEVRALAPDAFNPFKQQEAIRTTLQPQQPTPAPIAIPATMPKASELLKNDYTRFSGPSQPTRSEYIADRIQKDREGVEGKPILSTIQRLTEPVMSAIYGFETLPGVADFQRGANSALNISGGNPAPFKAPDVIAKPAEIAGMLAGSVTNPAAIEQNLVTAPYRAAQSFTASKTGQALTRQNRLAQRAVEGATAGAIQGGAISGVRGETDADELAKNIGIGAALGGAGDVAISGIARGIGSLRRNRLKNPPQPEEVLALPAPRQRGNANTAQSDEVISPEYTFALPGPRSSDPNPIISGRVDAPIERVGRAQEGEVLPPNAPQTRPRQEVSTEPATPRTTRQGERAFINTLQQSDGLTNDVRRGLDSSPERTYEPITNQETVNQANRRIERLGVDKTEARLLNTKKYKAEDVATGMRLIQQLQDAGQVERAVTIAEQVARQLTEAGQTVQAASIWNRLSPEGALLAAQRKVNRINENLIRGQAEVKISPAQADDISQAAGAIQAAGGSQERAGTVMEIMERIRKGESVSPNEKQAVADFVTDAKRFLKPSETRPPKPAKPPKEMADKRVSDRVVSFFDAQEQAALERIKGRRGQANALPLDEWADYAIVGASKLAKGTVKFVDWSEQMVRDLGENIRPHLRQLYEKSQEVQLHKVKEINDQVVSKAERIAERFITSKGDQLSTADVDFIRNMAQRVSSLSDQERRLASQDLQHIMQGFEKAGVGRKLSAMQYIAMLLNPLTQIRNIVGNEMLYRFERIAKLFATPIDMVASRVTGGPRTITFKSGPRIWDDYFKPAQDYWGSLGEGMRAGWRGVSPEGLTTKYELTGQAFRNAPGDGVVNKSINAIVAPFEKSLGAVLQGFDYAAYTRASNQVMREMAYLDALNNGIKGDQAIRNHIQSFMTNIDEAVQNIARDYGKFATLQNDSMLAQKIMGFRRGANKLSTGSPDFGAGSLVVPFAKTPANLLLRGLDYSPAGILKAMKQTYDVLMKPNTDLTRADVISSVTRALIGTGIGGLAYWLADKGAMFGRSNKDPEVRKLMQGTGVKDFQINGSALTRMMKAVATGGNVDEAAKLQPGDTLWAYQWAQPISMPMAVGSNVYQSAKDKQGFAQTAAEGALAGATTLLDSSVLSGIREAFQIPQGEDNVFKAVGMNLLRQLPGQFVPSMVRQFNLLFDEKQRETMAQKGDTLGTITNYAESSIPGLAQQMPQRVSTLGEPQIRPNTFFDVFLSPAARSKYTPSPEAQLVIDLLNETGDKNLAPRAAGKSISGTDLKSGADKKYDLTPEQFVELQTIIGQETANRLKKINPDLPTDRKIEMVLKAFDEAGKIGRNKLKRDLGLKQTK